MAGLFNILKVTVSEDKICAHVLVNPGMPLMTSEDIEATARVYYLVPAIAKHLCLGDSGREFQDCMGQTELCHLLEHVTVELMNETGLAGSISCGRTRVSEHDERVFEVELSCPDDALAIGALSSATFMMDWAYLHADQPAPDVEGTVAGLRNLVLGMRAEAEGKDPHEAVAAANGEDTWPRMRAPTRATLLPMPTLNLLPRRPAEPEPAEPQGVPSFDDEPQMPIDTEGAVAENHEAPAAVFGGAATAPSGLGARGQPAARRWRRRESGRHGRHACYAAGVDSLAYHHHVPALLPYADERERQVLRCGYNGQHSNGGHRGARRRGMIMGKTFSFVSGALFGAAAGAIIGVALAPRSGAETRAMAADIANDAWDNMRDTYEHSAEEARAAVNDFGPMVDAKTDDLRAKVDLARERMDQLREQLNDAISGGNVTPAADVVVENVTEAGTEATESSTEA